MCHRTGVLISNWVENDAKAFGAASDTILTHTAPLRGPPSTTHRQTFNSTVRLLLEWNPRNICGTCTCAHWMLPWPPPKGVQGEILANTNGADAAGPTFAFLNPNEVALGPCGASDRVKQVPI